MFTTICYVFVGEMWINIAHFSQQPIAGINLVMIDNSSLLPALNVLVRVGSSFLTSDCGRYHDRVGYIYYIVCD